MQIFINVPWYFSMLYSIFSPFLTQRTRSKFVISKEGNVAETLYKFVFLLYHALNTCTLCFSCLYPGSVTRLVYKLNPFVHYLLKFILCCVELRYIRPEDIPVQYGGLSRPGELTSGPVKPASEFTVKGGEKVNIQIEGIEVIYLSSLLLYLFCLMDW